MVLTTIDNVYWKTSFDTTPKRLLLDPSGKVHSLLITRKLSLPAWRVYKNVLQEVDFWSLKLSLVSKWYTSGLYNSRSPQTQIYIYLGCGKIPQISEAIIISDKDLTLASCYNSSLYVFRVKVFYCRIYDKIKLQICFWIFPINKVLTKKYYASSSVFYKSEQGQSLCVVSLLDIYFQPTQPKRNIC